MVVLLPEEINSYSRLRFLIDEFDKKPGKEYRHGNDIVNITMRIGKPEPHRFNEAGLFLPTDCTVIVTVKIGDSDKGRTFEGKGRNSNWDEAAKKCYAILRGALLSDPRLNNIVAPAKVTTH